MVFSLLLTAFDVLASGVLLLPDSALSSRQLGLIVNDSDPLSREVAAYYQKRRNIPLENVVHVRFLPHQIQLGVEGFKSVYKEVQSKMPPQVQAFALAWSRPYQVGCMSITTAFATGYDPHYCANKLPDKPCGISGKSPYFASLSQTPHKDFQIRPSMLLAATTLDQARQLIDRGVASDGRFPKGSAYLLSTSDKGRNVRAKLYGNIQKALGSIIPVEVVDQDSLKDKSDVMFYFTGLTQVAGLDSLTFLPGAVADHLTSGGGHMRHKGEPGQMSSLRWLEAGASGSYGTVLEPCNFIPKFPNPGLMISNYLRGQSLIESYWKSVAWPGEGLFIGEPLAAPFKLDRIPFEGESLQLPSRYLLPGVYGLEQADNSVGPYGQTGRVVYIRGINQTQLIDHLDRPFYRLVQKQTPSP